jgi:hypothetical protein
MIRWGSSEFRRLANWLEAGKLRAPKREFENSENLRLRLVRRKRLPAFSLPNVLRKPKSAQSADAWIPALWVFSNHLLCPILP